MKVLGINASPRGKNSNTLKLVSAVLKGAEKAGSDIEFIDLCSFDIEFCTGCGVCYETGKCIHDDDFEVLYEKMLSADGILLASPNYINQVTAQMKTMLDRMADTIHCQMFRGKYGCAVSTAGGSGADEVAAYLNRTLFNFGAQVVGTVGVVMGEGEDAVENGIKNAEALGKELVESIKIKRIYPEQVTGHTEMHNRMKALVTANKDVWKHEYSYLKQHDVL